jgi:hypothetical protein
MPSSFFSQSVLNIVNNCVQKYAETFRRAEYQIEHAPFDMVNNWDTKPGLTVRAFSSVVRAVPKQRHGAGKIGLIASAVFITTSAAHRAGAENQHRVGLQNLLLPTNGAFRL